MRYENNELSFIDKSADKTKMKTIFLELFEESLYTLRLSISFSFGTSTARYKPVKKPNWFSKSEQVNNLDGDF